MELGSNQLKRELKNVFNNFLQQYTSSGTPSIQKHHYAH